MSEQRMGRGRFGFLKIERCFVQPFVFESGFVSWKRSGELNGPAELNLWSCF